MIKQVQIRFNYFNFVMLYYIQSNKVVYTIIDFYYWRMKEENNKKTNIRGKGQLDCLSFTILLNCEPLTNLIISRKKEEEQNYSIQHLNQEIKLCYFFIKDLENHECGFFFKWPVDPYELKLKNYFRIIKKPIDLKTITHKILQNYYNSIEQVNKDIVLMFNNTRAYFREDETIMSLIQRYEIYYKERLQKVIDQVQILKSKVQIKVSIPYYENVDRKNRVSSKKEAILQEFFTKQAIMELGKVLCYLKENKKRWIIDNLLKKYPNLHVSSGKFQLQQLNPLQLYSLTIMINKFKREDYDFGKILDPPKKAGKVSMQQQKKQKKSSLRKRSSKKQDQQESSFQIDDSD